MKTFFLPALLSLSCLAATGLAAEEKPKVKEELKTLILEDAKNQAAKPAPKPATTKPEKEETPPPPAPNKTAPPAPATAEKPAAELAGTLPTVEVNRSKVTETNRELYEQDKKIARETKNIKPTELDSALNGDALNIKILGGESTKVRSGIARERVELMQLERDLIELMGKAKTEKEKADLKKQIDDIKTMRRELELQR